MVTDEITETTAALEAFADEAVELGKRYVVPDGELEVLCVKGGAGALHADDARLMRKGAAPLPASD